MSLMDEHLKSNKSIVLRALEGLHQQALNSQFGLLKNSSFAKETPASWLQMRASYLDVENSKGQPLHEWIDNKLGQSHLAGMCYFTGESIAGGDKLGTYGTVPSYLTGIPISPQGWIKKGATWAIGKMVPKDDVWTGFIVTQTATVVLSFAFNPVSGLFASLSVIESVIKKLDEEAHNKLIMELSESEMTILCGIIGDISESAKVVEAYLRDDTDLDTASTKAQDDTTRMFKQAKAKRQQERASANNKVSDEHLSDNLTTADYKNRIKSQEKTIQTQMTSEVNELRYYKNKQKEQYKSSIHDDEIFKHLEEITESYKKGINHVLIQASEYHKKTIQNNRNNAPGMKTTEYLKSLRKTGDALIAQVREQVNDCKKRITKILIDATNAAKISSEGGIGSNKVPGTFGNASKTHSFAQRGMPKQ